MQPATRRRSRNPGGDGLARDEHGRIRRESIPNDRRGNPGANRAWVLYRKEQGKLPYLERDANKMRPLVVPTPKALPPVQPVEAAPLTPTPRALSPEEALVRDLRKRMERVLNTPDLLRQLRTSEPEEMRDLVKDKPSGPAIQRWENHAKRLLGYVVGS